MGVGFLVFAIYYIGLIGGESLANKNIVSPFVAMWIDNIVFLLIGLVLVALMGNENTTSRGGQFAERVDAVRAWFQRRARSARLTMRVFRPLDRYVFGEFWKIFFVTALGFPILLVRHRPDGPPRGVSQPAGPGAEHRAQLSVLDS